MKSLSLLLVAALTLALFGCAPLAPTSALPVLPPLPTPSQVQQVQTAVTATKDAAAAVAATAAVEPNGAPVVKAADAVVKVADVVQPILDKVTVVSGAVADLKTSVGTLADKNASLETKLAAMQVAINTAPQITNATVPGSREDAYVKLGAIVGTIVLVGLGQVLGHKTVNTAITTPGTTLAPADPVAKGSA